MPADMPMPDTCPADDRQPQPQDVGAVDTLVQLILAIPESFARPGPRWFKAEVIRRLTLRGWACHTQVMLEPGTRGDDTARRTRMDLLATPPQPSGLTGKSEPDTNRTTGQLPVLVEFERAQVTARTRAKLKSWGSRPALAKLVIVLYCQNPDPIPEATQTIGLQHHRKRWPRGALSDSRQKRRLQRHRSGCALPGGSGGSRRSPLPNSEKG